MDKYNCLRKGWLVSSNEYYTNKYLFLFVSLQLFVRFESQRYLQKYDIDTGFTIIMESTLQYFAKTNNHARLKITRLFEDNLTVNVSREYDCFKLNYVLPFFNHC